MVMGHWAPGHSGAHPFVCRGCRVQPGRGDLQLLTLKAPGQLEVKTEEHCLPLEEFVPGWSPPAWWRINITKCFAFGDLPTSEVVCSKILNFSPYPFLDLFYPLVLYQRRNGHGLRIWRSEICRELCQEPAVWPWRSTLCSLVQSARHERGGGLGCTPTSFLVFKFTFVVIPDIHCAILRSSPTLSVGEGRLSPWTWPEAAAAPGSALQRVQEW